MSGRDIIHQLDALLRNNQLDTRAGLHFMGELVKDAFEYIESQKTSDQAITETLHSFKIRIGHVEDALNEFLKKREDEQREAKEERKWWRRLIMGGMVTMIISEVARWFTG